MSQSPLLSNGPDVQEECREGAPPECRVEALDWTREGSVAAEVAGRHRNEPSVLRLGGRKRNPS